MAEAVAAATKRNSDNICGGGERVWFATRIRTGFHFVRTGSFIRLRLAVKEGGAYIVYPKNADSYEERTFALQDVTGKKKVSFAFLPGSNFDFSYFRFEK